MARFARLAKGVETQRDRLEIRTIVGALREVVDDVLVALFQAVEEDGVRERQFRRYYAEANRRPGKTGDNLVVLLESRLTDYESARSAGLIAINLNEGDAPIGRSWSSSAVKRMAWPCSDVSRMS